jgi:hypothetical protein
MPQRSPIVFWLLVAATLCVDAVAWTAAKSPHGPHWELIFDALAVGQLGVVCIWSTLRAKTNAATRVFPWIAVVIASLAGSYFGEVENVWEIAPYYGLYVALLLMALWLLVRTTYGKGRIGSALEWKYSVAQLLIVMTVASLLAGALRGSGIFEDAAAAALFILGSVAVAVASLFSWSGGRHVLIRLAGALGVALAAGLVVSIVFTAAYGPGEIPSSITVVILSSHYLIQASVLSIWITLGQLLPPRRLAVDGDDRG